MLNPYFFYGIMLAVSEICFMFVVYYITNTVNEVKRHD